MSTKVPVKSILKQQPVQPSPPADDQKAKAEKDRHNLNIALHHAYRIQNQKDVEAQILSSIETLIETPAASIFTSNEANKFTTLVQQFQPSDLDALVEERRIDGRCGYALCRNPPRSASLAPAAAWKLAKGAGDFCSGECGKKSMYVKSQLSEVPAWERDPSFAVRVVLHQDDQTVADSTIDEGVTSVRQPVATQEDLAAERGEKPTSLRPKQVMADNIVEKISVSYKPLSSLSNAALSHTAIEGYEPKEDLKATEDPRGDADDDTDHGLFDNLDERGVGARIRRPDGSWKEYWNGKADSSDDDDD